MGLHPPKPIRKTKERICTQKPIKRFRHKANCRIHRHASDFRQPNRSGFAKVGVVSSNLIARSRHFSDNKGKFPALPDSGRLTTSLVVSLWSQPATRGRSAKKSGRPSMKRELRSSCLMHQAFSKTVGVTLRVSRQTDA